MTITLKTTWHAIKETGLDPNDPFWVVRDSIVHMTTVNTPYLGLIASFGYESEGPDAEAAARLCAAAPDLLAACQSVMFLLGPSTSFKGQTEITMKLVEAALAKAKGESQ